MTDVTEVLLVLVVGLAVIAAAAVVGPRLGIAAPLVLVAIGVVASLLPMFGSPDIDPEVILQGILPPLLYSAAVSMPAMNFRREFGAISGLSVLLVVGSTLVLGVFFMLVVPQLGFAAGAALGAIISPTDAVATTILRKAPVSKRVIAILDGESLLNDATALVLLRTAIAAITVSFSFWEALGKFAFSVAVACAIGWLVGRLNLLVRKRVTDPTVNTVISFTVPFVAAVPANLLDASGLVAAVVAGIVTGIHAPRDLSPQNRLSDSQNWRTATLVLEGAVFLTMGVQIKSIVQSVQHDHKGVGMALLIAAGALAVTLLVRTAYITPLLGFLRMRSRRVPQVQDRLQDMQQRMDTTEGKQQAFAEVNHRRKARSEHDLDRFATRITRVLADIAYFVREPLGWREGTAVVWAGMRGAVTVAAAQTLPGHTPQRSVLVLIAFAVAAMSLLVQGGTIGPLLRLIAPKVDQAAAEKKDTEERDRLFRLLRSSAETIPEPEDLEKDPTPEGFAVAKKYRVTVLRAQRSALLDARDDGTFDADVLEHALATIDASEIDIEMRGEPVD